MFGKTKAAIQAGVNLSYIGAGLANNYSDQIDFDYLALILSGALVLSAGFGIKGILKRRKS
jgi:hypothetical protein